MPNEEGKTVQPMQGEPLRCVGDGFSPTGLELAGLKP
jgi:hypothetical protein